MIPKLWPWIVLYVGGALVYGALGGATLGLALTLRSGKTRFAILWGSAAGVIIGSAVGAALLWLDVHAGSRVQR